MARTVREAFAEEAGESSESAGPSGRSDGDAGEESILETIHLYLQRKEGLRMRREVKRLVKKREEAGLPWPPLDQHVAVNVELAELLNDLPHIAPDLVLRRPQLLLAMLNQAALRIEAKICNDLKRAHKGLVPADHDPAGSAGLLAEGPLQLPPQLRLPLPGDEADDGGSLHGSKANWTSGRSGYLKGCTTQQMGTPAEAEQEEEDEDPAQKRSPSLLGGICPGNVRLNMMGSALDSSTHSAPSISSLRIGQHDGCLVTLRGIVIRCGPVQMLEGERTYACARCGHRYTLSPDLEHGLQVELPSYCNNFKGRKRCGGQEFKRLEEEEATETAGSQLKRTEASGKGGRQGSINSSDGSECATKRRKRADGTWIAEGSDEDMVEGQGAFPDLKAPAVRDIQEIRIQEQPGAAGHGSEGHSGGAPSGAGLGGKGSPGFMPRSIRVLLLDHLADSVRAGEEVAITGVVQCKWLGASQGVRCNLEPVLVANAIWSERQFLAEQEREAASEGQALADGGPDQSRVRSDVAAQSSSYWKEFSESPLQGRNAILHLICPQLHGMGLVKLATCLALIGAVHSSTNEGSTQVRGDSHLLLVGDPGTGKSVLLAFAGALMQRRSIKTTGLGSSHAGLTATAIRESGQWLLAPGALVLAHGGICCVDDFSRIRKDDMAAMHEAMEQQSVSVAKAGLVTQLPCRCTVLAASTPGGDTRGRRAYGRDGCASVASLGLPPPLLSRFDLVLVLKDQPSRTRDRAVAQHIIRRCCPPARDQVPAEQEVDSLRDGFMERAAQWDGARDLSRNKYNDKIHGAHESSRNPRGDLEENFAGPSARGNVEDEEDAPNEDEGAESMWSVPFLQRYLQFVRTEFQPVVSDDAAAVLSGYYRLLRSTSADALPGGGDMAARLTVRMLDSLVRLAQAHARLMCRGTVAVQDAVMALVLMDASLASCAGTPGFVLPPVSLEDPLSSNPDLEYKDTEAAVLEALGLQREGPGPSPSGSPGGGTKAKPGAKQKEADFGQYCHTPAVPGSASGPSWGGSGAAHGRQGPERGADSGDELEGGGFDVVEDWGSDDEA